MVTPLLDRDTLDIGGLERLIEHILAGGVSGLFILGSTGEGPSLSYRLRVELVQRVCRQVATRVPVLVGITDSAFIESVKVAQSAAEAGAQAVVLSAPYYFSIAQSELLAYVKHITAELPLPLFLYNLPGLTKIAFEIETVQQLMGNPKIIGLKDSSANMIYFHHLVSLLSQRPDWTLLIGPEELLAEAILLGGHGGICAGANLRPRLYVDLCRAAAAGQRDGAAVLHREVMKTAAKIYQGARQSASVVNGIKSALACLGICQDVVAEPFQGLSPEQRKNLQYHLTELGIVPATRNKV